MKKQKAKKKRTSRPARKPHKQASSARERDLEAKIAELEEKLRKAESRVYMTPSQTLPRRPEGPSGPGILPKIS